MRTVATLVACLGLAGPLAGCATPYQEMGFSGGVTAAQVSSDVYRISARGNGYTSDTAIQDYALLKAAETTKAAGGTHFQVLSGRDASSSGSITTPGHATTNVVGRTAYTTYSPGATVEIFKPGQDNYIRVLRMTPGQKSPEAISADEIIQYVGPRVKQRD
jgi:hypothetical protein